jgi:choline-sulfatase
MRTTRRQFLQCSTAATLTAGFSQSAIFAKGSDRPVNTLIIKSDEHNPFFSSLHGHPFVETPNLDRMARQGVVFENTYCPSPLCMPSRSSFCSGRRVHEIQTYSNCNIFKYDYPSYGRILAGQGVHTVHIGKTDFYNSADALGFSEMILPKERGAPDMSILRRDPLFIRPDGHTRASGFGVNENNFKGDRECAKAAMRWLKESAPGLNKAWTLEVNLVKPHFPHHCSQELWDRYSAHEDLPAHGRDAESANHPFALDLRAHFETDRFSEQHTRGLRRGYYGCVTFIDEQVGLILNTLEEAGLADNTLVAYTSDHGEMLGKFGMWWKCSLYEDSARVPLVVRGPGFGAGERRSTPVDLLDVQATMFHNSGAERPQDWTGTPLQGLPPNDKTRALFAEYHGHGTRSSGYLIRKGDWKLHYGAAGVPPLLFNLAADPEELTNLAGKEPEKLAELTADLHTICDPEKENAKVEEMIAKQLAEYERVKGGKG